MTTNPYLRSLQRASGISDTDAKRLVSELTEMWFAGRFSHVAASEASIEAVERIWRRMFVQPFLERLNTSEAARLAQVDFGLLFTGDANAWCIRTPDGRDLIVLHAATPRALLVWWECFSGELVGRETTAEQRKQAMSALSYLFGNPRIPFSNKIWQLSELEIIASRVRANADVQFILAHEYAHIFLGHTGVEVKNPLPERDRTTLISWRHDQEYAADRQALEWLIDTDPVRNMATNDVWNKITVDLEAMPTGWWHASHWFHTLLLLQWVELFNGIPDPRASHPSAADRMFHLAAYFTGRLSKDDNARVANFLKIADEIRSMKTDPEL